VEQPTQEYDPVESNTEEFPVIRLSPELTAVDGS